MLQIHSSAEAAVWDGYERGWSPSGQKLLSATGAKASQIFRNHFSADGASAPALAMLEDLRTMGVRIALDDFGTGYSSLSYRKRFRFDKIKIDRCFIGDIGSEGSAAIVQAVVNIATARNMTTTAEGVETEEQRNVLRNLGCREMQGYLFSRPQPAAEIRSLLSKVPSHAAA